MIFSDADAMFRTFTDQEPSGQEEIQLRCSGWMGATAALTSAIYKTNSCVAYLSMIQSNEIWHYPVIQ